MRYNSSFSLDSVIVVESLPPGDLKTGTDLFETTIAPRCLAEGVYGVLYTVSSKVEFFGALEAVRLLAAAGRSPLLHLEVHGDETGLQVASGEIVLWSELAPALARVNETSRMNLLVVAAACNGWHLTQVLRPIQRAPCWAVMGPPDTVKAGALYDAMKRFYSALLPSLDVMEALRALNNAAEMSEWDYKLTSADILYCRVFKEYLRGLSMEESQSARVNRLVADVAREQSLDVRQTMLLRAELREALDQHEVWFDKYRQRFLMLDLFPENRARFPLTLSDCLPRSA